MLIFRLLAKQVVQYCYITSFFMSQNFYHKMQHAQQWMQQQVQEAQQNIVSNHTLEQKVILFLSKHTAQPIPE